MLKSFLSLKKLILTAIMAVGFHYVMAGPPPPPPPPPMVPIDGGVSLLAAAGVAYGIKKYSDRKKRK